MARIYAYGSSTIYGLYGGEKGGFVEQLKATMLGRSMESKDGRHNDVFNEGETAQPIHETIEILERNIRKNRNRKSRVIGIFLLGAIESATRAQTGEPIVNLEEFSKAVKKIGKLCTENAIIPIFIGIPPLDDRGTHPFESGETFDTQKRKEYDAVVRESAKDINAPFIETWEELGGDNAVELGIISYDSLHIGPEGHRRLHDLVLREIDSALAQSIEPEEPQVPQLV